MFPWTHNKTLRIISASSRILLLVTAAQISSRNSTKRELIKWALFWVTVSLEQEYLCSENSGKGCVSDKPFIFLETRDQREVWCCMSCLSAGILGPCWMSETRETKIVQYWIFSIIMSQFTKAVLTITLTNKNVFVRSLQFNNHHRSRLFLETKPVQTVVQTHFSAPCHQLSTLYTPWLQLTLKTGQWWRIVMCEVGKSWTASTNAENTSLCFLLTNQHLSTF